MFAQHLAFMVLATKPFVETQPNNAFLLAAHLPLAESFLAH